MGMKLKGLTMTDLFKNQYHPQTFDDYVGDMSTLQYYIERSLNSQEVGRGFILYGLPGTGKSTIVGVLANHYEMDLFLTNSSDERNHIDGNIIHTSSLLSNQKKLVVFDEIDGLTDKAFKELGVVISNYSPIILIANDISRIPNFIKSKCYIKEIVVNKFALKSLANKIIKQENLDIDKDTLNKDLVFIKSYRGLLDYLQFGYTSEIGSFENNKDIRDEITFINDNSESPKLISLADIFLKRSQWGYKAGQKISKFILNSIDMKSSDYPRTYRLIYEVKNKKVDTGTIRITGFK